MGFVEGQIYIGNDNDVFNAGQTIRGRIVFDQEHPKTIHGIYASFKGYCKVHWTTTRRRRVNNRTVSETIRHDSYEEYFNLETYMCGAPNGDHNLQAGHHEYSFDFTLPTTIPSSYEGAFGHIRYRVKVIMDNSGFLTINKEKRVPIRVTVPVDLNLNSYCMEPLQLNISKTYCCWCLAAGSSEIQVKLPAGGYCPGQTIPIEVNYSNLSRVTLKEIKFALKRKVKFIATRSPGLKTVTESLVELVDGPVAAGTVPCHSLQMELPAMEAYNFDACRYIDINHYFKVSVEVSGCHKNSEISERIILGNIPLVVSQNNMPNVNLFPAPAITYQPQPNNSYPPNMPYPNQPYPYPQNQPYASNQTYPNVENDSESSSKYDPPPPYPGINPSGDKPVLPDNGNNEASVPLLSTDTNPTDSPPNPFAKASAPQI